MQPPLPAAGSAPPPEGSTAPEFQQVVPARRAADMFALTPELTHKVEAQADAFVRALLAADVHGDDFKRHLDSAFRLGHKEIADATRLNTGFLQRNYRGLEESAAYKAMAELRDIMDNLNPGRQGNLFEPVRILGVIPGGDRLKAYFRKFESATSQIDALVEQLSAAQDDLERDVVALDETKAQLWSALQNLRAAACFAELLQRKLSAQVEAMKPGDPLRARALEQEALFYAAQNLEGILTQLAVTANGYLALEPLKKTAREMSMGIERLKTTGMAALAVGQTMAIATGHQMKVQAALQRTRAVLADLVEQTAVQLGQHVETVGKTAGDPVIEIGKLQAAFDNTFKALDSLDNFRSAALGRMQKNSELLQELIDKARPYLERAAAGAAASGRDPDLIGPVAL